MKQNRRTTLIVSLVYLGILSICWSIALHFDEDYTYSEAFEIVFIRIGALVFLSTFGLIIGSAILAISKIIRKKKKR